MPRGSRPGERRGGRKKGSGNKSTKAIRKEVRAAGIPEMVPFGVQIVNYFMGEAAREQAGDENNRVDKKLIAKNLINALKAIQVLLPFTDERKPLAVRMGGDPDNPTPVPVNINDLNNGQMDDLLARLVAGLRR